MWGAEGAAQRKVDILEGAFPQQRAFIEDPAKLKWALCTRRAAKSYSDGLALAKAALDRPDVSCLYIGLTRESAKRIMWKDVLKAINLCLATFAIWPKEPSSVGLREPHEGRAIAELLPSGQWQAAAVIAVRAWRESTTAWPSRRRGMGEERAAAPI